MAHLALRTVDGKRVVVLGPPGVPTGLVATTTNQTRIDLTWTLSAAKPPEKGVRVERSQDGVTYIPVVDLPAGTTAYQAGGLIPGTRYWFRVRALGLRVQSAPSAPDDDTTFAPDSPVASFTAEATEVTVGSSVVFTNTSQNYTSSSWKVDGVEVSTLDNPSIPFNSAGDHVVTLTVNGAGGSDTTSPGTTVSVASPVTPTLLSVTGGSDGSAVAFRFNVPVSGHSGLSLKDGSNAPLGLTYSSGDGTDTLAFVAGRTFFRGEDLRADYGSGDIVRAAGGSPALQAFTGIAVDNQSDQQPASPPDPPTGLSASVAGDLLTVSFDDVVGGYENVDPAVLNDFAEHGFAITSDAGGLRIHEYDSGSGTDGLSFRLNRTPSVGEGLDLRYVPGLVVSQATGDPLPPFAGLSVANANTGVADPVAPGTPTDPPPDPVTHLVPASAVACDDWTVFLAWKLADDRDTKIEVQRSVTGSGVWDTVATLAGGTTCFFDRGPLSPSTGYSHRVRAGNVAGWSDWYATTAVTTAAGATGWIMDPTTNPTFVSGDISGSLSATALSNHTIRLDWTTPRLAAAGLLHIYRSDAGGPFARVKCVPLAFGAQTWTDVALTRNTRYAYRAALVLASAAYGPWAEVAATTANAAGVPDPPADLSHYVKSATETVVLIRDRSGGTATHLVETAPVPGPGTPDTAVWTQAGVIPAGETAFRLTTTAKRTVYVRVRADVGGVKSGYTAFDASRTVVRPPSGASGAIDIGPGQTYATIAAAATATLTAKRIRIHAGTYAEKLFLVGRGRASDPLIVEAVGGAVVIDGLLATTPSAFDAPSGYIYQDFVLGYVGKLSSDPNGYQPGHLRLTGITFRRSSRDNQTATITGKSLTSNVATVTLSAPHSIPVGSLVDVRLSPADPVFDGGKTVTAVTSTTLSYAKMAANVADAEAAGTLRYGLYVADDGTTRAYSTAASGLYVQSGDHVVVDGCVLADNGNGLFGANNGTDLRDVARLVVRGNTLTGNGTYQSDRQHTSYVESRGVVYEANHYLANRAGASGAGLKDRSTDVIVRGGRFEMDAVRFLDLVECQNQQSRALADPGWGRVFVFNTLLSNFAASNVGATTPINWGQDDGADKNGRRQPLAFYHNTLCNYFQTAQKYRIVWFRTPSKANPVCAANNVFLTEHATSGGLPEPDLFSLPASAGAFGVNYVTPGWAQTASGASVQAALAHGTGHFVSPADNRPDFIDAANRDFRVLGGTASVGLGGRLPLDWPIPDRQSDGATGLEARPTWGLGSDLGYTAAAPDTSPPTVSGVPTIDPLGATIDVTWSENCVGSDGLALTLDGTPVALAYDAGGSVPGRFRYALASPALRDQQALLAYTAGDITDVAGNPLGAFSDVAVTNGSQVVSLTVPAIRSADYGTGPNALAFTRNKPAGTASGDLLVAVIVNATSGGPGTTTGPSGWTKRLDAADGFSAVRLSVWTKIAGGSEPDTYAWASNALKTWSGGILRITGHHPTAYWDVAAIATQTSGTAPACPDATASADNSLVIRVCGTDFSNFTSPGSPYVEAWRVGGAAATAASAVAVGGQASAGAVGSAVFAFGSTNQAVVATAVIAPAA